MIVDMHTHLLCSEADFAPKVYDDMAVAGINPDTWAYTQDEYLAATDAADRCVVFGLRAAMTGWMAPNARVAAFCARYAAKYIYFAAIDPSEDDAMEQLDFEVNVNHARGVKIGPIYQGLHPLSKAYQPIYAYCQGKHLPIIAHMGTTFSSGVPLEYARPAHMDEVAIRYPDLKLVIAHMGHPWEGETIAAIRRNRNLYADISALYYRPWQFYNSLRLAVEYGCTHKLLFGSDFPATTTQSSIDGVRGVNDILIGTKLPIVPNHAIDALINRDTLRLLSIE